MEKYIWTEDLSVNVKEIDEQHSKLIDFINAAEEKLESKDFDSFSDLLQELTEHSNNHFETEEKYFHDFDFEGADNHIKEHTKIKVKLSEYIDKYNASKSPDIILDLLDLS